MEDDDAIEELTTMIETTCAMIVTAKTEDERQAAARKKRECQDRCEEVLRYVAGLRRRLRMCWQQSNGHANTTRRGED